MTYQILTTFALSLTLASCGGISTGGAGSGGTGPIASDGVAVPTIAPTFNVLDSSVTQQDCAGLVRTLTLTTADSDDMQSTTATITASITNTSAMTLSDTRTACASFTLTDSAGNNASLTSDLDCATGSMTNTIESYAPEQQVNYVTNWQPVDTGRYQLTFNHQTQDSDTQTCPTLFLDIEITP